MSADPPENSPADLEARLTALLLGELSGAEAAALAQAIEADPHLAALHQRLRETIGLVRAAALESAESAPATTTPLRLSEARRQKLAAHFKTIAPVEFAAPAAPRRTAASWLVPLGIAAVLMVLITGLFLPALSKSKTKSMSVAGRRFALAASRRPAAQTAQPLSAPPPLQIVLPSSNQAGENLGLANVAITADDGSDARVTNLVTPYSQSLPENGQFAANDRVAPDYFAMSKKDNLRRLKTGTRNLEVSKSTTDHSDLTFGSELTMTNRAMAEPYSFGGVAKSHSETEPAVLSGIPNSSRGKDYKGGAAGFLVPGSQGNASSPSLGSATMSYDPGVALKIEASDEATINAISNTLQQRDGIDVLTRPEVTTESGRQATDQATDIATIVTGIVPDSASALEAKPASPLPSSAPASHREGFKFDLLDVPTPTIPAAGLITRNSPAANAAEREDRPLPKSPSPAPAPQLEILTSANAFSTFSLNVSDASFKLAAASLDAGVLPDPATIRSEEFINAFDYRDPEAPPGVPIAFAWERARDPFAQNRDLLRFSIKTAATGRVPGRPLNLVLLLDNSGSMERADRVRIIREALRVLAAQLHSQDTLSIVTFARTPRLQADGVPGDQAAAAVEKVAGLTPQGGTNLEAAMKLAYETALRHYLAGGVNRVVLLTDGAANLGAVSPGILRQKVAAQRRQGIALDCFGIGWEDYNDDLLEVLARTGGGRYAFINHPEEAATDFARKLAGALDVAALNVKVQVEFNPARVTAYRQVGYARHQLTRQQFRDDTVAAAQIGAAEAGNALYVVEVNSGGTGPLATVRCRYQVPGDPDYHEHEWIVPYAGNAVALAQASPAMRLAATAAEFSEWLASSPYAAEATPARLLQQLSGVPAIYGADPRPQQLESMLRQAESLSGK